ncbi:hypothetical protein Tco_0917748 [Tanacetum coccineum]
MERLYNLEKGSVFPHKVSHDIDEIVTDAVEWARHSSFTSLLQVICPLSILKEILQSEVFEDESYIAINVHKDLSPPGSQPLTVNLSILLSRKRFGSMYFRDESGSFQLPPPPPPPPPPTGASGSALQ